MPAQNISNDVIAYLKTRANEVVTATEIVAATGLTGEQVRYAMRRTLEKTSLGNYIKVVNRGNTWEVGNIPGARKAKAVEVVPVPEAPRKADTLLIEMVGKTNDGQDVVRTPNGNLWKLLPL